MYCFPLGLFSAQHYIWNSSCVIADESYFSLLYNISLLLKHTMVCLSILILMINCVVHFSALFSIVWILLFKQSHMVICFSSYFFLLNNYSVKIGVCGKVYAYLFLCQAFWASRFLLIPCWLIDQKLYLKSLLCILNLRFTTV